MKFLTFNAFRNTFYSKVIFGGGRTKFLPNTTKDHEGNVGEREDGRDLIEEWKSDKQNAKYIFDKEGLENIDFENTDNVLGLFAPSHMDFNEEADRKKQPDLLEMTEAAIKILQKENAGYFLFVEGISEYQTNGVLIKDINFIFVIEFDRTQGGRIDHGHHMAQAVKALEETVYLI